MSVEEIKEIVEAMDYDGDGEIDYTEFVTAALHITQQQRGDRDAWQSRVQVSGLAFLRIPLLEGEREKEREEWRNECASPICDEGVMCYPPSFPHLIPLPNPFPF